MAGSGLIRKSLQLALIGLAVIPLVVAIASLSAHGHRWPDIIAQFSAPAVFGAILILILAILMRSHLVVAMSILLLGLNLAAVMPQWAPNRGWPEPMAPRITLYFANLFVGNNDVGAIGHSIRKADADIVVLAEMSDAVAAGLDDLLSDYPHRAVQSRPSGRLGDRLVIASRLPLVQHAARPSEAHHVVATVQTGIGPIDIIGLHLTRPWPFQYQWAQIRQVQSLAQIGRESRNPVILAGDFNSVSSARIGRQIRSEMGMTPAPAWPGTWPAQAPSALALSIDHVYYSQELALLDRRLGLATRSDHRPIIVRLTKAQTGTRSQP